MARVANESDLKTLEVIGEWYQVALSGVCDIEGWRDGTAERYHYFGDRAREWGVLPVTFRPQTEFLICKITGLNAKLDPMPLMDLFQAIACWHDDHSAERVPGDRELWTLLDRSMMTLGILQDDIFLRSTDDKPTDPGPPREHEIEPGYLGFIVDREKRIIRVPAGGNVDLNGSIVEWHIFETHFSAMGKPVTPEMLRSNYPGEWGAMRTARNSLNQRLGRLHVVIRDGVLRHVRQPLDGSNGT